MYILHRNAGKTLRRVLCYTTFAAKVGRGLSISRATLETLSSGGRESKYNQPTPPPPEGDQACPLPITISYLFLLSLPVSWLCRFLSSARLSKKKEILVPRRRRRRRQKNCKCSGDFHRKNFPPPFPFLVLCEHAGREGFKGGLLFPFSLFFGRRAMSREFERQIFRRTDGRTGGPSNTPERQGEKVVGREGPPPFPPRKQGRDKDVQCLDNPCYGGGDRMYRDKKTLL